MINTEGGVQSRPPLMFIVHPQTIAGAHCVVFSAACALFVSLMVSLLSFASAFKFVVWVFEGLYLYFGMEGVHRQYLGFIFNIFEHIPDKTVYNLGSASQISC